MYTKCLVDSGMPISIAAQELLYPAFHFVPNPDAIDFSRFPKCLMFQFGYTCSGLEGYAPWAKLSFFMLQAKKDGEVSCGKWITKVTEVSLCGTVVLHFVLPGSKLQVKRRNRCKRWLFKKHFKPDLTYILAVEPTIWRFATSRLFLNQIQTYQWPKAFADR